MNNSNSQFIRRAAAVPSLLQLGVSGASTAFFMFDSYVEPNLSNLITHQAKISSYLWENDSCN